jgi:hypothetical protein
LSRELDPVQIFRLGKHIAVLRKMIQESTRRGARLF